jgi:hypothetical protein
MSALVAVATNGSHLAAIYAILGEYDEAAAVLADLLCAPSGDSLTGLLLEPLFPPLAGHTLLAAYRPSKSPPQARPYRSPSRYRSTRN